MACMTVNVLHGDVKGPSLKSSSIHPKKTLTQAATKTTEEDKEDDEATGRLATTKKIGMDAEIETVFIKMWYFLIKRTENST